MKGKILLLALFLFASISFAIQPADYWVVGQVGKFSDAAAANVTTEGGNVTELNLTSNQSTEKWAGFWGNVSGRILLAPNPTNMFYTWAWAPADGGEVCAIVQGSSFNWATIGAAIVAGDVNTAWGFDPNDADDALTTINNPCTVTIGGISAAGTGNLTGVGGFETCAVADTAAPTSKNNIAFCVNMTNNGNLFNGQTGDYELLVATNETVVQTETYQFWVELS